MPQLWFYYILDLVNTSGIAISVHQLACVTDVRRAQLFVQSDETKMSCFVHFLHFCLTLEITEECEGLQSQTVLTLKEVGMQPVVKVFSTLSCTDDYNQDTSDSFITNQKLNQQDLGVWDTVITNSADCLCFLLLKDHQPAMLCHDYSWNPHNCSAGNLQIKF
jgi:hypothetical protein